jgi:outer membrane autotransporter barrel domain
MKYSHADTVIVPSGSNSLVLNYAENYLIEKQSLIYSDDCYRDTIAVMASHNSPDNSEYVNVINNGSILHAEADEGASALSFMTSGGLKNTGRISGWDWGLIFYGESHSLQNRGEILGRNGTAISVFDNAINIINSGIIAGQDSGIDALDAGEVSITNNGQIKGVKFSGVIMPSNSSLYNTGVISSQNSAAIFLSGVSNAITLGSGSQLSGKDNIAVLSGSAENTLTLEGTHQEKGDFSADVPEHSLARILSTQGSNWTLSGKISAWGSTPAVIEIAGRLALTGEANVGGGGDTRVTKTGHLILAEGGSLTSSVVNHGMITVGDSSPAQVYVPDFTINGDISNAGKLQMSPGGQTYGHNLRINGNYNSDPGSVLIFNGKLAGDSSPIDKLTVNGNAAGTTAVDVRNLGGGGAKTEQGIELIRVNGTSSPDAFVQNKRIVAGSYDYFLQHARVGENNSHWYLSSTLNKADSVAEVKPAVEQPNNQRKVNILRPEAGAYAANSAISNRMFITTLVDRATATAQSSSLWLRQTGLHQILLISDQLEDSGNQYVSQLGSHLFTLVANKGGAWHIGAMAGYGYSSGTTRSNVTGYRAQRSLQGYSVGLSATWFADETSHYGFYSDNWLLYSTFNNRVKGDDLAGESWKSSGMTASSEWGYRTRQRLNEQTSLLLQPQMQIIWMGVNAGDHKEANGSKVTADNASVATRMGLRSALESQAAGMKIQPFVELNWWHNSRPSSSTINGSTTEIAGMKNMGEIKSGIGLSLNTRTDIILEANAQKRTVRFYEYRGCFKSQISILTFASV